MKKIILPNKNLQIEQVSIDLLKPAEYNPRKWDKEAESHLKESITRFGIVDPLLVNSAPKRKGVVIGGHFRLTVLKPCHNPASRAGFLHTNGGILPSCRRRERARRQVPVYRCE